MTNSSKNFGHLSPNDTAYKAGLQCHKRKTELFIEAGYEVILPTVGNHELGGRCSYFWNNYLFACFYCSIQDNNIYFITYIRLGDNGFIVSGKQSKLSTVPSYKRVCVEVQPKTEWNMSW